MDVCCRGSLTATTRTPKSFFHALLPLVRRKLGIKFSEPCISDREPAPPPPPPPAASTNTLLAAAAAKVSYPASSIPHLGMLRTAAHVLPFVVVCLVDMRVVELIVEAHSRRQRSVINWGCLLIATSGALKRIKCSYCIISFCWKPDGTWAYEDNVGNENFSLGSPSLMEVSQRLNTFLP
jgi:hypothetical protein